MQFLPAGSDEEPMEEADAPLLAGQRVPLVQEYTYLRIRLTPKLSVPDMVADRFKAGLATVNSLAPFLRCPMIHMGMRRKIVSMVVLPRLLFGSEIYGMNRELTNAMQRLLNKTLRDIISPAGSIGHIGSVSMWGEMGIPPICALAAARRARAWSKAQ